MHYFRLFVATWHHQHLCLQCTLPACFHKIIMATGHTPNLMPPSVSDASPGAISSEPTLPMLLPPCTFRTSCNSLQCFSLNAATLVTEIVHACASEIISWFWWAGGHDTNWCGIVWSTLKSYQISLSCSCRPFEFLILSFLFLRAFKSSGPLDGMNHSLSRQRAHHLHTLLLDHFFILSLGLSLKLFSLSQKSPFFVIFPNKANVHLEISFTFIPIFS